MYKNNDLVFSFLQLIFKKINKNTNIKLQNIKTFIKNCYTFNFVKVFNNSFFSILNEIIYFSKFLAKLLKLIKLKNILIGSISFFF